MDKSLFGALNELDLQLGVMRQLLDKAWHISNGMMEDFFDLRDEKQLSDNDICVLKCGYHGAALEHDIVHDYISTAQEHLLEAQELLEQLQEQVRKQ